MLTEQQWKDIEKKLQPPFGGIIHLNIDSLNISLGLVLYKKTGLTLRYCILVYIDEKIKLKWLTENPESCKRFWNLEKRPLYKGKNRTELKKLDRQMTKRDKSHVECWNTTFDFYTPGWFSFQKLKRHLLKFNNDINLV